MTNVIKNAHLVNKGKIPDIQAVAKDAALRDFYWVEQEDPEKVIETIKTMMTKRIPERFNLNAEHDIQVLSPLRKGVCGTRNLNFEIQELINPREHGKSYLSYGEISYRPGDRVMQTVNNYDLNVFKKSKFGHQCLSSSAIFANDFAYIC